jgi:hypothetical protein
MLCVLRLRWCGAQPQIDRINCSWSCFYCL